MCRTVEVNLKGWRPRAPTPYCACSDLGLRSRLDCLIWAVGKTFFVKSIKKFLRALAVFGLNIVVRVYVWSGGENFFMVPIKSFSRTVCWLASGSILLGENVWSGAENIFMESIKKFERPPGPSESNHFWNP